MKEELQRKEQIKEAARKRQEKLDDMEAKRRIMAKIAADKEERRRKAEEAKAAREGRPAAAAEPEAAAAPAEKKPAAAQARLRLQTPSGILTKTLPAETTLLELAQMVEAETGAAVGQLSTTFPTRTFAGASDMGLTLKEAGLTPSASVTVG
jgi:hypothetical protein